MNNIRIAVTLLNTLRHVGPVSERDQALLNDTLQRELGADYAGFLAEPVPSGDGVRVDWYVDTKTRPQAFEDLDAPQQKILLAEAQKRMQEVKNLADHLELGSRSDKEVATALRNAMHTPESGWLYNVDGKPVIVGWGYVSATTENRDMGLKALGTAGTVKAATTTVHAAENVVSVTPEEPIAPQPEVHQTNTLNEHHIHHKTYITHEEVGARRPFNWLAFLAWLLFALLLLIFLWLLFSSNSLNRWGSAFNKSTTLIDQNNEQSIQHISGLNQEISALENELQQRYAQCVSETPLPNTEQQQPEQQQPEQQQPPAQQPPAQQPQQVQQPAIGQTAPTEQGRQPVVVAPTIINNQQQPSEREEPTPEEPQQPEQSAVPEPGTAPVPTPDPAPRPEPATTPTPEEPTPAPEPHAKKTPPQSPRQKQLDDRIKRSGAKSGALQVTLIWNGRSDLDLSIGCPGGARVYFKRPRGCGAHLDRDANRTPRRISAEPIENIYFANPNGLPSQVPVYVDYYDNHGDPNRTTPFRLRVRKTTVDPATGKTKVQDKIIDGVADGSRRRSPRRVYVINNP